MQVVFHLILLELLVFHDVRNQRNVFRDVHAVSGEVEKQVEMTYKVRAHRRACILTHSYPWVRMGRAGKNHHQHPHTLGKS